MEGRTRSSFAFGVVREAGSSEALNALMASRPSWAAFAMILMVALSACRNFTQLLVQHS